MLDKEVLYFKCPLVLPSSSLFSISHTAQMAPLR